MMSVSRKQTGSPNDLDQPSEEEKAPEGVKRSSIEHIFNNF
jgi:hypothetical protein